MPAASANCAVVVPPNCGPGSHFVVDSYDGSHIDVTVPDGSHAGATLIVGAPRKQEGSELSSASAYAIETDTLKDQNYISRIASLGLVVPADLPADHDLFVGSPFGGAVYSLHIPEGVKPGQRICVQVPVYTRDESPTPAAAHVAAPEAPALTAASSSLSAILGNLEDKLELEENLSKLEDKLELCAALGQLEDDIALMDEEIAKYFVAGLEEVSTAEALELGGEAGEALPHVVVGKLVRHRTDKWLRLNREKSAYLDKHTAKQAQKEHPGRARRAKNRLGGGAAKAWKSLRSIGALPSRAVSRKALPPAVAV